jgi:hypothetical protein
MSHLKTNKKHKLDLNYKLTLEDNHLQDFQRIN